MPSCQIEQHNENSSENGIAIPDSIMWGHHDFQNNDTKMDLAGSNDAQAMVGYGYTSKSVSSGKTKVNYSSTSPIVIGAGLPGGTYFVEIIAVTKTLNSYRAEDLIINFRFSNLTKSENDQNDENDNIENNRLFFTQNFICHI